ncbi:MAG: outer membrane beta-barrel protein [Bacteroidia bacterium]|nr:outer membrane beta-barrel protein [Bacteroidia bacterium]
MKQKFTLLFFIFSISYFVSKAQSFNAGIYAGLSACQVDGDALVGYNKPGPILAGFVNKDLKPNWQMQMEIEYIQKGSRQIPKPQNGNIFYLIRLNYIQIPVMFKYFNKGFGYEAGLSYGRLINWEVQKDFASIPITPLNPNFFKNEYAFCFGVGTKIGDRFYGNWRFSYSILAIRDYPTGRSFIGRSGQYNNLMEFTLGYFISRSDKK